MVGYTGGGRVQESGELQLASPNEIFYQTRSGGRPVDRIPSMNDSLVRKVKRLSGGVSVCSVHFIIHQFDGAEDRWPSVYDAA